MLHCITDEDAESQITALHIIELFRRQFFENISGNFKSTIFQISLWMVALS